MGSPILVRWHHYIESGPSGKWASYCMEYRLFGRLLVNQSVLTIDARSHDDVIKWKHFSRNWPFVSGIHRSLVASPYKGQWREALMFSLTCAWTNGWAKPLRGRWFETPSCSLWCHCNGVIESDRCVLLSDFYMVLFHSRLFHHNDTFVGNSMYM